jgi:hypothetical protein
MDANNNASHQPDPDQSQMQSRAEGVPGAQRLITTPHEQNSVSGVDQQQPSTHPGLRAG